MQILESIQMYSDPVVLDLDAISMRNIGKRKV